jgi:PBP1b-binding outer membrane lipoprotein LpoB
MKKISIAVLAAILVFSMAACGRKQDNTPTTKPTTQPTEMTILPNIDPTLDTNIPDPNINTEIPTYTDGTDPSGDMRSGMMN